MTKAIEDALNSPLLRNRDIFGSRSLLLNLYMSRNGDNSMAMTEVQELRNFVNEINPEVDIIWGVTVDNDLGDKVKITILAAGFDVTIREEEGEILANQGQSRPAAETTRKGPKDLEKVLLDQYGDTSDLSKNYIILTPEQMNDDSVIELLEKSAAFNRDKKIVENLRKGTPLPQTTGLSPERPERSSNRIEF